ncbi:MAG TPA: tolB protein [Polyangiaceae bacterium]|jgi:TolB protein|nr:tolB protein [Polyangiaceae bacterium]
MRRFIARTRASSCTGARPRPGARACTRVGVAVTLLSLALPAHADAPAVPPGTPAPDEGVLGEFVITGSNAGQIPLPKIAVLPSLSPDLEDVIVRGVVRRDFELTGMYDVIPDSKAPQGLYGFDDTIDVDAWQKLGAEAIVKVAAQKKSDTQIQVLGIAYFLNVGKEPVYQKTIVVNKGDARITGHRITDALLGALTGRNGSFASELTFSGKWAQNRRIFRMDADGNSLLAFTDPSDTAIAPNFGLPGHIFYSVSHNYSPFGVMEYYAGANKPLKLPFNTSVYSLAFNKDRTKLAVAVAGEGKSAIYVGNPDGTGMNKVSTSELATRPAWSPSGKLAWVGGDPAQGSQRIWVDGKPVSPAGFTAASPAFCDTEDGVKLVYSVQVGGNRQDLVIAAEKGQNMARLTQNQGSNSYPACSPDGRLVAFFSNRNKSPGIWLMSLKSWKAQQISTQEGETLNWAALPGVPGAP